MGKALVEGLEESDIICLNDGSPTHLCPATGSKSAIDLSFADIRSSWLFNWKVGDE